MLSLVRHGRISGAIHRPLGSFPFVFKPPVRGYSNGSEGEPPKIEKEGKEIDPQGLHGAAKECVECPTLVELKGKAETAVRIFYPIVKNIISAKIFMKLTEKTGGDPSSMSYKGKKQHIADNLRWHKEIGFESKSDMAQFAEKFTGVHDSRNYAAHNISRNNVLTVLQFLKSEDRGFIERAFPAVFGYAIENWPHEADIVINDSFEEEDSDTQKAPESGNRPSS